MMRTMLVVPVALALVGASAFGNVTGSAALFTDEKNVYVVGVSGMT